MWFPEDLEDTPLNNKYVNLHLPSFFGGGNFRVTSFEFELDKLEPINKRSKHLFDSFIINIASDGQ